MANPSASVLTEASLALDNKINARDAAHLQESADPPGQRPEQDTETSSVSLAWITPPAEEGVRPKATEG